MPVDGDAVRAEKLLAWLVLWPHSTISSRQICQRAPRPLRKVTNARRVAGILERLGCLRRMPEGAAGDGPRPDVWRIVRRGAAIISCDKPAASGWRSEWRLVWVDQIARVERELAEAVPRIEAQRPPYDVSAYRWSQYQSDVALLVERWGHHAAMLGLGLEDLIGWDGTRWFPSTAKRSLAWRLSGYHTIVSLERDRAICDGGRTVFWKLAGGCGWMQDGSVCNSPSS
jgi:hypothetical protein